MSALREDTLNWMRSLPISELRLVLSKMPVEKQRTALLSLKEMASRESSTERDKDVIRKREQRSESARIEIPECKNPKRREECLQDPERFLVTYFADRYRLGMGKDHRFIIQSIYDRAHTGGRQAIAAPRGRGKSEIVKGMIPYLVLANLVRFPLPIAATTPLAKRLYVDFKKKIATNDCYLKTFPRCAFRSRRWKVRRSELVVSTLTGK
jgi:tRNA(Met) C34 N-acetyltransferase TmcA